MKVLFLTLLFLITPLGDPKTNSELLKLDQFARKS
jgi:hypothetical protein